MGATIQRSTRAGAGRRGFAWPDRGLVLRQNESGDLIRKVDFSSCMIDGRLLWSPLDWLRWSVSLVVVAPGEERAPPEVGALFFEFLPVAPIFFAPATVAG